MKKNVLLIGLIAMGIATPMFAPACYLGPQGRMDWRQSWPQLGDSIKQTKTIPNEEVDDGLAQPIVRWNVTVCDEEDDSDYKNSDNELGNLELSDEIQQDSLFVLGRQEQRLAARTEWLQKQKTLDKITQRRQKNINLKRSECRALEVSRERIRKEAEEALNIAIAKRFKCNLGVGGFAALGVAGSVALAIKDYKAYCASNVTKGSAKKSLKQFLISKENRKAQILAGTTLLGSIAGVVAVKKFAPAA